MVSNSPVGTPFLPPGLAFSLQVPQALARSDRDPSLLHLRDHDLVVKLLRFSGGRTPVPLAPPPCSGSARLSGYEPDSVSQTLPW